MASGTSAAAASPADSRAATTETICSRFDLPGEARALLNENMSPRAFFAALVTNKHYLAAIDLVAYALPARDAIWWGALCLQHAFGAGLPPVDRDAARAAVSWVLQPTEARRTTARALADAAGLTTAGMLAAAVGQTGAAPAARPVPPAPFASAKSARTAIRLAVLKADPPAMQETQRLYAELGMDVALGHCPIPNVANGSTAERRSWPPNAS